MLVTTVNAALQRVLSPFRIRAAVRELKPGMRIGYESLTALLQRQGYSRMEVARALLQAFERLKEALVEHAPEAAALGSAMRAWMPPGTISA